MKSKFILIILIVFAGSSYINAQDSTAEQSSSQQHQYRQRFIDKDGDGYNDNAPDHDGDGIPNGLDPDYEGTGKMKQKNQPQYIDLNGDGINDLMFQDQKGKGFPGKRGQMEQSHPDRGQTMEAGKQKGRMGDKKKGKSGRK